MPGVGLHNLGDWFKKNLEDWTQETINKLAERRQLDEWLDIGTDSKKSLFNWEYPEGAWQTALNAIGIAGANRQTQLGRQLQMQQAARTGGRLGSVSRGFQDIAGQVATGQQQAIAQLTKEKVNIETRMKMAALQAYIQKYGIDENVRVALKQIAAGESAAMWQGAGAVAGGLLPLLAFL
jgi:hypothetical protein